MTKLLALNAGVGSERTEVCEFADAKPASLTFWEVVVWADVAFDAGSVEVAVVASDAVPLNETTAAASAAGSCWYAVAFGLVAPNSWPSKRDARLLARDETADAISLQSWIVSVYGSPIGTDVVWAYARVASKRLAPNTAPTIDRFTPQLCGMGRG